MWVQGIGLQIFGYWVRFSGGDFSELGLLGTCEPVPHLHRSIKDYEYKFNGLAYTGILHWKNAGC